MGKRADPINAKPSARKSSATQLKQPDGIAKRGRHPTSSGKGSVKEAIKKAKTVPLAAEIASTTTKTKKIRKFLGENPSISNPLTLSPLQKETFDMSRPDTSKLASDSAQIADDVSKLARSAIDAIRAAADEFASKAGVSRGEAVDAVRNASHAAMNGIGNVAGEARAMTETGLDTLGKSVVRNPLAALAIAAGTGLLLGLLSRSGQDNRR